MPPPVNVVYVPNVEKAALSATAAADYFVIDATALPWSTGITITGCDPAHDYIVVENLPGAETATFVSGTVGLESYAAYQVPGGGAEVLEGPTTGLEVGGSYDKAGDLVRLVGLTADPVTFAQNNLILTSGTFDLLT